MKKLFLGAFLGATLLCSGCARRVSSLSQTSTVPSVTTSSSSTNVKPSSSPIISPSITTSSDSTSSPLDHSTSDHLSRRIS